MADQPKQMFCSDCAMAIDFCCRGYDGKPICCKCAKSPSLPYRLCSSLACNDFEPSEKPLPTEFGFFFYFKDDSEKVVPLFVKDSLDPFVIIPVCDIPPGGISMEKFSI